MTLSKGFVAVNRHLQAALSHIKAHRQSAEPSEETHR